jgi:hypothetical protein
MMVRVRQIALLLLIFLTLRKTLRFIHQAVARLRGLRVRMLENSNTTVGWIRLEGTSYLVHIITIYFLYRMSNSYSLSFSSSLHQISFLDISNFIFRLKILSVSLYVHLIHTSVTHVLGTSLNTFLKSSFFLRRGHSLCNQK